MKCRPYQAAFYFPEKGWTLVELLVAMALGLLIIAGIGQIYLAAKRSYDIQADLAQIQDVGRYVVEILTQDIRNAGYWGLMDINLANSTPTDDPPTLPPNDRFFLTGDIIPTITANDGCLNGSDQNWGKMITQKVFGLNDTSSDPSADYGCIGGDRLRGDILTVRYADPVAVPASGLFNPTSLYIRTSPFQGILSSGDPSTVISGWPTSTPQTISVLSRSGFTVTATLPAHGYFTGDTVSVSGATPNDYNGCFTITSLDANTFTYTINTSPSSPATGSPILATAHLYDCAASNHLVVAHSYYVADPILTECGDVPVFARKTLDSNGAPLKESLVNGVEQLQFQYGVDTDITSANPSGDGSINQYFNANQFSPDPTVCTVSAPCWNQVRAVRFWVLVRADCPESGYTDTNKYYMGNLGTSDPPYEPNDHYRRALYAATVTLRN